MSQEWIEFTHRGEELYLEHVSSPESNYTVGYRHGSKNERGHVLLMQNGDILTHKRAQEPRSVEVSDTGRVVYGDWITYGESTGADVEVFNEDGDELYSRHFNESSPLVDISPGGDYIVVCPYDGKAYIESVDDDETEAIHQYDIADRLNPEFTSGQPEPEIEFSDNPDSAPLYRIDLDGNICWQSDSFESQQYYQVLSLDETVSWRQVIEKCATDYGATSNEKVRHIIANTIGDARLVDATGSTLEEVIDVLEEYKPSFTKKPAHSRLLSQTLGEAYYRLAKERVSTPPSGEFWRLIERAGEEYINVLPWYDGKDGLATVLRYQGKQYRKLQRPREAFDCYLQIELIEDVFDVEVKSDADKKHLQEFRDQGIESKEPEETGRLAENLYMHTQ
jgi:hypothetical protein